MSLARRFNAGAGLVCGSRGVATIETSLRRRYATRMPGFTFPALEGKAKFHTDATRRKQKTDVFHSKPFRWRTIRAGLFAISVLMPSERAFEIHLGSSTVQTTVSSPAAFAFSITRALARV